MKNTHEQEAQMSYADDLRETQQREFPLLSEVTRGLVDEPLSLMNCIVDEEGTTLPCALPDTMWQGLPQMMSETLSLYEDADIRTMLLTAMMPTIGSAMSHVRVRHEHRLYSMGMMNVCVGPSASGKGTIGDVASLVDGINETVWSESEQALADYRKRCKRYERRSRQLSSSAKSDPSQLIDINDIADEVEEPKAPLRRMHKLPVKTTSANLYRLLYANGDNISFMHIAEVAELNAANRTSFGDFKYIYLAAQNEEALHTGRKTDDEDYLIPHTRLSLVATGTLSSIRDFIPNLEDGLSTRFLYHNLPAKSEVRDEMDEAMANAINDVYAHYRAALTAIWSELRLFEGKPEEELPRLVLLDEQRQFVNDFYRQMVDFVKLVLPAEELRAPILRSRLNLYRIAMIISILRRYDAMDTAEGMFGNRTFTVSEADLHWALTYIFYIIVQASTIYGRLYRKAPEEAPRHTRLGIVGFLQLLPKRFTTTEAIQKGKEMGLTERGVETKLYTMCNKGYVRRLHKGYYEKTTAHYRSEYKKQRSKS